MRSSVAAAPVICGSHSGIYGSAYLSRNHLKRAIKYGSSYGAAPVVVEQKEVTENSAPVVRAPLFASRYNSKGGYHSFHHFHHDMGGYGAPVVHSSVAAAPVIYGSLSGIYGSRRIFSDSDIAAMRPAWEAAKSAAAAEHAAAVAAAKVARTAAASGDAADDLYKYD